MSELEVQGLVKRFEGKLVIDHVSFRVMDDEFFVLLGPSEGGKTMLLRLICGFEKPDEGSVLINGRDVTETEPYERSVAVVFQENGLFPHMTVYENISYALRFRRLPKAEVEMRVITAAEMLGLSAMLNRPLVNLSGGEQQRVAIGRVMVKDAEIYLFDEPISQLDPLTRHRIRQEILMVHRIKGKPSIYITQNQYEALNLANHVAIIANGKVHQVGTPQELLHVPSNLFVARFLSDPPLNLLEGYVQHVETRYRLQTDALYFTFPISWTRSLARLGPQSSIILGIRPSIIEPEWAFDTLGRTPHVQIRVQVLRVGPLMGKRTVLLRTEYGTELTAEFKETNSPKLHVGEVFFVGINPEKIFFFHPHSEELLNPIELKMQSA